MKTTPCQACGQPIAFIVSKANHRPIPVDPALISASIITSGLSPGERVTLVTIEGTTIAGVHALSGDPEAQYVEGYVAHWATCPQAERFRSRRNQRTS